MPKYSVSLGFDEDTMMALLWNDPRNALGYGYNERGRSVRSFGPDITHKFLQKHNLSLMIRSHQYQVSGYSYTHSNKCLTVFSCPDYKYTMESCYILFNSFV